MRAPSSRPTRCRRSGLRAVMITAAPSWRACRAVSSPMPELPPITTRVWPASGGSRLMLPPPHDPPYSGAKNRKEPGQRPHRRISHVDCYGYVTAAGFAIVGEKPLDPSVETRMLALGFADGLGLWRPERRRQSP